ncbi:amidohydrolase family protein [symbiont of Argiope bruennichi]|uniref:amidohydrolase family protein n=1 Tax=symbiont of Argiope bruennichi TaxID=2810479 RepID=UPI003DA442B9
MNILIKDKILLKNAKVFFKNKIQKRSILIKNGYIIDIFLRKTSLDEKLEEYFSIDCSDFLITPSLIDGHVHTRNPGFEYKENVDSFVECCVNGGILDVIAMGNTSPRPETIENFQEIEKILTNKIVKIHQVANITLYKNGVQTLTNFEQLKKKTSFFSDDGAPLIENNVMKSAIKMAKKHNIFLLLHEENRKKSDESCYYNNKFLKKNGIGTLKDSYEWKMIERDILLNKNIDCKMHFQHLSTAKSLNIIENGKKFLKNLSCEVTFNHLALNNKIINNTLGIYKVNPPIPTYYGQKKLLNGVKKNLINIIVSDHAPHTKEEKECHFSKAMYGITSCELLFPVIYSIIYLKKKIPLENLIKKITIEPFKLFFDLEHNISLGKIAKISVFDIKLYKKVTAENLYSKGKNTLFLNKYLTGWCKFIIFKDKIITPKKKQK